MNAQPDSGSSQAGERFAYFMIRIQTNADTRAKSSGVVERLGTGRKQSFSSIEELVRLLIVDPGDGQNMMVGTASGNESAVTGAEPQQVRRMPPNKPLGSN